MVIGGGCGMTACQLAVRQVAAAHVTVIVVPGTSATLQAAQKALIRGCSGLLGQTIPTSTTAERSGAVLAGTPQSSPLLAKLRLKLSGLGREGFVIRSVTVNGQASTVIAAASETGVLYGTFHFLRLLQTGQSLAKLNITQKPRLQVRMLNHLQERDAVVWGDACLLYLQTFSKRPLPAGVEKPAKTLDEYKAKSLLNW